VLHNAFDSAFVSDYAVKEDLTARLVDRRNMSYKPDYGLKLFTAGVSQEIDQYFYNFTLYSLTVLGVGRYSTMVDVPFDGERCALSLDFNQEHLEQILAKALPHIADFIRQEIFRDPSSPRTIDFEGKVIFGVRARLGQLQVLEFEHFVPLIAKDVF
jgi:hypothetical protein